MTYLFSTNKSSLVPCLTTLHFGNIEQDREPPMYIFLSYEKVLSKPVNVLIASCPDQIKASSPKNRVPKY